MVFNVFVRVPKNSVALVGERTTPIERPPIVGEVSANFCELRVSRGQHNDPLSRILYFLDEKLADAISLQLCTPKVFGL
jgi:hypothetical protein